MCPHPPQDSDIPRSLRGYQIRHILESFGRGWKIEKEISWGVLLQVPRSERTPAVKEWSLAMQDCVSTSAPLLPAADASSSKRTGTLRVSAPLATDPSQHHTHELGILLRRRKKTKKAEWQEPSGAAMGVKPPVYGENVFMSILITQSAWIKHQLLRF